MAKIPGSFHPLHFTNATAFQGVRVTKSPLTHSTTPYKHSRMPVCSHPDGKNILALKFNGLRLILLILIEIKNQQITLFEVAHI